MSALRQCIVTLSVLTIVVNVQCQTYPGFYSFNGQNTNRRYGRGSSDITFPDSIPSSALRFNDDNDRLSRTNYNSNNNFNKYREIEKVPRIPLEISNQLNNLTSFESFYDLLDPESMDPRQVLVSRIGGESVERSLSRRPVPANCLPEMTVVPLKLEDENESRDPTIVIFPSCTRVNRCGGCCNNNLLSCQPVLTQHITFEVFKSQYQGGNKMKFLNRELVFVEEHTKCKCDCRKKESECTKFQRYDKSQCMCNCINLEDQNKCLAQNNLKIWDTENCICRCRDQKECTTGSFFDENTCSCIETPGLSRNTPIVDRKRFILKPYAVPETPQTFYQTEP